MKEIMKPMQAIEDKYGLVLFRMGLTYLFDVGWRNLTDENVAETIKQIMTGNKKEEENSIMTVEFQCEIVRCAAELSKFGIWDLICFKETAYWRLIHQKKVLLIFLMKKQ